MSTRGETPINSAPLAEGMDKSSNGKESEAFPQPALGEQKVFLSESLLESLNSQHNSHAEDADDGSNASGKDEDDEEEDTQDQPRITMEICDAARVQAGSYPEGEHPLETQWTLWYDRVVMTKNKKKQHQSEYVGGLRELGSFNTVESFYSFYAFLKRPAEFPVGHSIFCFRLGVKPAWEALPYGGCWIIRIRRHAKMPAVVNQLWETLLLAVIGEGFGIPDVVGCALSAKQNDDVLTVWNADNRNSAVRFKIGERLKEILKLEAAVLIQYKENRESIADSSTYRNAKNYMFAPIKG